MFSREIFGFKPKKLEFGVQPQKVPETDTVRSHASERRNRSGNVCVGM